MPDPATISRVDRPAGQSPPLGALSVALVCPGWPPEAFANGIIPYVANVADELRPLGHRVAVFAEQCRDRGGSAVDGPDVVDASVDRKPRNPLAKVVDALAYRASPGRGEDRRAVRALVATCHRLIEERGLQVVEMEESFGRVARVAEAVPIPVVVKLHGPWFVNGPLRDAPVDAVFRRRVEREGDAIRGAALVVAPSLEILERTRAHYRIPLERAEVIPNPTEIVPAADRWRTDEAETSTILFVGRFDRHKGGDLVIDAFAEVARSDPRARLRFVGPDLGLVDDSGRSWRIEEFVRDRLGSGSGSGSGSGAGDAAERFEWLGPRPGRELPALRRKAGVVVVGSRYDNFPNTVLEAMALGCPLVAPRVGGVPEMVEDGVNGLLFDAGRPSDMAPKLLRLLEDRPLAARLGARAGEDCERRYSPSAVARSVVESYRRAIDEHRRSGRPGGHR